MTTGASEQLVGELEQALLERAEKLAEEYLARARRAREHILEDAHERLRLREERELLAAQAESERHYRRLVQANELRLKSRLDQLRWRLIQEVMETLPERLEAAVADPKTRWELLRNLIDEAVRGIESEALVVEANADDHKLLEARWQELTEALASDKQLELHPSPRHCRGGVLVRDRDNCIRIDNTFEGRIERFTTSLWQVITERLFAADISQRGVFND